MIQNLQTIDLAIFPLHLLAPRPFFPLPLAVSSSSSAFLFFPLAEKLSRVKKHLNPYRHHCSEDIFEDCNCRRKACSTNSSARDYRACARHPRARGIRAQARLFYLEKFYYIEKEMNPIEENSTNISKDDNCDRNAFFHKQPRTASARTRGMRAASARKRVFYT